MGEQVLKRIDQNCSVYLEFLQKTTGVVFQTLLLQFSIKGSYIFALAGGRRKAGTNTRPKPGATFKLVSRKKEPRSSSATKPPKVRQKSVQKTKTFYFFKSTFYNGRACNDGFLFVSKTEDRSETCLLRREPVFAAVCIPMDRFWHA